MALIIDLKVVPSSGRHHCSLDKSGQLKCFLKSPAEDGKANAELCKLIAKALKITTADVTIMTGASSRTKRIKIESNVTHEQLLHALGIHLQMRI